MSQSEHFNISYIPGGTPEQTLDLFLPSPAASLSTSSPTSRRPALLVFVHGGGWRTGTKSDFHTLARNLTSTSPFPAVALIDYRLSTRPTSSSPPSVLHPAHVLDVFTALKFLRGQSEGGPSTDSRDRYDAKRIVLVGHSVGAWMTAAAALDTRPKSTTQPEVRDEEDLQPIPPMPELDIETRKGIRAFVLVDGLLDIEDCLTEYPSYASMIGQAFNAPNGTSASVPSRGRFSSVSFPSWSLPQAQAQAQNQNQNNQRNQQNEQQPTPIPHFWLTHSPDDELLDLRQTRWAASHLMGLLRREEALKPFVEEHAQIVQPLGGGEPLEACPPYLNIELDKIKGTHEGLLQTPEFRTFLSKIMSVET